MHNPPHMTLASRSRGLTAIGLGLVVAGSLALPACRLVRPKSPTVPPLQPAARRLPALRLSVTNGRAGPVTVRVDGQEIGRIAAGRTWSYPYGRPAGDGPWRVEIADAGSGAVVYRGEVEAWEPAILAVSTLGARRLIPEFLDPEGHEGDQD
jgi:hypothetical protein